MNPNEIKAELAKRGITQVEIGLLCGHKRQNISAVINGRANSIAIRQMVAKAVGKDIKEVFPDERFRRPSGRIRVPSSFFRQSQAAAA